MLRELIASFDIDTGKASGALRQVDTAIDKASATLGALAQAFIGSALVRGIDQFVEGQIDMAKEVRLTAAKLGVTTDELQEFQFAAGAAGVSAEGAATGLKFLNKNMGLALEGNQEAVQAFKDLKIEIKDGSGNVRDLGAMLPEISDAFEHMGSQQERTTKVMQLFGRQGADLLPLLQQGSKGLVELRKRYEDLGGGMDHDFIAKAKEAGKALGGMRFGLAAFKRAIASEMFPYVAAWGDKMQGVIAILNRVMKQTHLAAEIVAVLGAAASVAGAQAAIGFGKMLGVLPKGGSFWKSALGLVEVAAVVAGVVLLALIFEDLFSLMKGEGSLIGDIITEFLGAEEAARLANDLNTSWELIKGTMSVLKPDLEGVSGALLSMAKDSLPFMVGMFVDLVRLITAAVVQTVAFVSALGQIPGAISSGSMAGIGKTLDAADAQTAAMFKNGSAALNSVNRAGNGSIPGAKVDVTDSMIHGGGRGSEPSNVSNQNNIDITINGVKDASGAGQAAKAGVKSALQQSDLSNAYGAAGSGG